LSCTHEKSIVLETRRPDGSVNIYRRRTCTLCHESFVTVERPHTGPIPGTHARRSKFSDRRPLTQLDERAQANRMASGAAALQGVFR
jgi:transcriptional regulator NrdR family protein